MAKKPRQQLDEEAILRLRDGVGDPGQPLDADGRRALADARLRALAFALGSKKGSPAGPIDDAILVDYLLNLLPPYQRHELEQALIGDPEALHRVMALRLAFDRPADKRDRQHADLPERKIPRHRAAQIEIRQFGDRLRFRDALELLRPAADPRLPPSFRALARREAPEHRSFAEFRSAPKRAGRLRPTWGLKTGMMVGSGLDRVSQALRSAARLADESRRLLARRDELELRQRSRPAGAADPSDVAESRDLESKLAGLLQEFQSVVSVIRPTIEEMADMIGPPWEPQLAAQAEFEALHRDVGISAFEPPVALESESWTENWTVETGPWMLDLTGFARPNPEMTVAVRDGTTSSAPTRPFLTLIRGQTDFNFAELNDHGMATFEVPTGNSKLLVQGSEVWEIGLSLRSPPQRS